MRKSKTGLNRRDALIQRNTTHGLSRLYPKEYRIWKDIRGRCNRVTSLDYPDYGARGIKVCERWNDFAAFFADMGVRPPGLSIDRIDVNGDYEPANCRWADAVTQANNKRTSLRLEMDGITHTITEWCREFGVERTKVQYRLSVGLSLRDALTAPNYFRRGA